MIEGLRLLPWLSYQRERIRDESESDANDYLNCHSCKERAPIEVRRGWHCGFLATDSWSGSGFFPPAAWPKMTAPEDMRVCSVCPGYSTSLPTVREAARALTWANRSHLVEFYGEAELTEQAKLAIDVIDQEIKCVERHAVREAREGNRGNR